VGSPETLESTKRERTGEGKKEGTRGGGEEELLDAKGGERREREREKGKGQK
jgi:hypothetical protein